MARGVDFIRYICDKFYVRKVERIMEIYVSEEFDIMEGIREYFLSN